MKLNSSETERDRRLAVAAFLRDSDGQNKERMQHIHHIMTGQPILPKEYPIETHVKTPDPEEKAFWRSFRIRSVISLLLTAAVYIAVMAGSSEITSYVNRIKKEIAVDYSENVFDFFEQIPYTLDYEKINAKG